MSIKVGDKFIIEIGTIAELPDGRKKYFIKPFESLVFDRKGLEQLEPIEKAWENELEEAKLLAYKDGFEHGKLWAIKENAENRQGYYDNGYNNALEDVNHAMAVINAMAGTERAELFEGHFSVDRILCEFPVQRIVEIIKAYEEKKKAEEECIKVGDEVVSISSENKAIVTLVDYDDDNVMVVFEDGSSNVFDTETFRKTGRHYDEVEQLLSKLRGENND